MITLMLIRTTLLKVLTRRNLLSKPSGWRKSIGKEYVTKKSDLSNFYFNLDKNVAYGSRGSESIKPVEKKEVAPDVLECCHHISPGTSSRIEPPRAQEGDKPDFPSAPEIDLGSKADVSPAPREEPTDAKHVLDVPPSQEKCSVEPPCLDQTKRDHHKRSEDAVTAAKERFWPGRGPKKVYCSSLAPPMAAESRNVTDAV